MRIWFHSAEHHLVQKGPLSNSKQATHFQPDGKGPAPEIAACGHRLVGGRTVGLASAYDYGFPSCLWPKEETTVKKEAAN
jgi:hypothetical protein